MDQPKWQNVSFQNEVTLKKKNITELANEYRSEQDELAKKEEAQKLVDSKVEKIDNESKVVKFIFWGGVRTLIFLFFLEHVNFTTLKTLLKTYKTHIKILL